MATLKSITVKGVRSYSPYEAVTIEFDQPLTLLLGANGSGKTTLIECLKLGLTGILPPDSKKGKSFIHDLNVAKAKSMTSEVQVTFDIGTKRFVASRILKLSRTAGKHVFKTMETSLRESLVSQDDVEQPSRLITNKNTDMDQLLVEKLAIKKPIINYVLLCHQEEACWPLNEGQSLKSRMDEVFETVRYTRIVKDLKRLRDSYLNLQRLSEVTRGECAQLQEIQEQIENEYQTHAEKVETARSELKRLEIILAYTQDRHSELQRDIDCLQSNEASRLDNQAQLAKLNGTLSDLINNFNIDALSNTELESAIRPKEESSCWNFYKFGDIDPNISLYISIHRAPFILDILVNISRDIWRPNIGSDMNPIAIELSRLGPSAIRQLISQCQKLAALQRSRSEEFLQSASSSEKQEQDFLHRIEETENLKHQALFVQRNILVIMEQDRNKFVCLVRFAEKQRRSFLKILDIIINAEPSRRVPSLIILASLLHYSDFDADERLGFPFLDIESCQHLLPTPSFNDSKSSITTDILNKIRPSYMQTVSNMILSALSLKKEHIHQFDHVVVWIFNAYHHICEWNSFFRHLDMPEPQNIDFDFQRLNILQNPTNLLAELIRITLERSNIVSAPGQSPDLKALKDQLPENASPTVSLELTSKTLLWNRHFRDTSYAYLNYLARQASALSKHVIPNQIEKLGHHLNRILQELETERTQMQIADAAQLGRCEQLYQEIINIEEELKMDKNERDHLASCSGSPDINVIEVIEPISVESIKSQLFKYMEVNPLGEQSEPSGRYSEDIIDKIFPSPPDLKVLDENYAGRKIEIRTIADSIRIFEETYPQLAEKFGSPDSDPGSISSRRWLEWRLYWFECWIKKNALLFTEAEHLLQIQNKSKLLESCKSEAVASALLKCFSGWISLCEHSKIQIRDMDLLENSILRLCNESCPDISVKVYLGSNLISPDSTGVALECDRLESLPDIHIDICISGGIKYIGFLNNVLSTNQSIFEIERIRKRLPKEFERINYLNVLMILLIPEISTSINECGRSCRDELEIVRRQAYDSYSALRELLRRKKNFTNSLDASLASYYENIAAFSQAIPQIRGLISALEPKLASQIDYLAQCCDGYMKIETNKRSIGPNCLHRSESASLPLQNVKASEIDPADLASISASGNGSIITPVSIIDNRINDSEVPVSNGNSEQYSNEYKKVITGVNSFSRAAESVIAGFDFDIFQKELSSFIDLCRLHLDKTKESMDESRCLKHYAPKWWRTLIDKSSLGQCILCDQPLESLPTKHMPLGADDASNEHLRDISKNLPPFLAISEYLLSSIGMVLDSASKLQSLTNDISLCSYRHGKVLACLASATARDNALNKACSVFIKEFYNNYSQWNHIASNLSSIESSFDKIEGEDHIERLKKLEVSIEPKLVDNIFTAMPSDFEQLETCSINDAIRFWLHNHISQNVRDNIYVKDIPTVLKDQISKHETMWSYDTVTQIHLYLMSLEQSLILINRRTDSTFVQEMYLISECFHAFKNKSSIRYKWYSAAHSFIETLLSTRNTAARLEVIDREFLATKGTYMILKQDWRGLFEDTSILPEIELEMDKEDLSYLQDGPQGFDNIDQTVLYSAEIQWLRQELELNRSSRKEQLENWSSCIRMVNTIENFVSFVSQLQNIIDARHYSLRKIESSCFEAARSLAFIANSWFKKETLNWIIKAHEASKLQPLSNEIARTLGCLKTSFVSDPCTSKKNIGPFMGNEPNNSKNNGSAEEYKMICSYQLLNNLSDISADLQLPTSNCCSALDTSYFLLKLIYRLVGSLRDAVSRLKGEISVHDAHVAEAKHKLQTFCSKNTNLKERTAVAAARFQVAAAMQKDLVRYRQALATALNKLHAQRIRSINERVALLWPQIYSGKDIDRIELRCIADENDQDHAPDSDKMKSSLVKKPPSVRKRTKAKDFVVATENGMQIQQNNDSQGNAIVQIDDTSDDADVAVRLNYDYVIVMRHKGTWLDMPGRSSAGQRVVASTIFKLGLADAFCNSNTCNFFVMDEPTTNLDSNNIKSLASAIVKLIKHKKRNPRFQLIIITHDTELLEYLSQAKILRRYWLIERNKGTQYSTAKEMNVSQLDS